MLKTRPDHPGFIRPIHEFLFSLNLGLVWVLERSLGSNSFWVLRLQYRINSFLHLNSHSDIGAYAAALGLALGLAVGIFLLLRVFVNTFLATEILRSVAGIAALMSFPACWFYVVPVMKQSPISTGERVWLLAELGSAILCASLYFCRKWPLPTWVGVGLLVFHYGFWGCVFFGTGFVFDPRYFIFPLVGLCSSLAWGVYVGERSRRVETSKA